jgi:hypothetical protein
MKTTYKPDPAGIFGAAMSLFDEGRRLAKVNGNDLSDAYSGHDGFMRECMRIATEFEAWACKHVDFEELGEVWPYFMHDKFGTHALAVIGSECQLDEANATHWAAIAHAMKMPMRSVRGWVPYPILPDAKGRFTEDLKVICQLVGSSCYHYEKRGRDFPLFFIRRAE